MFIHIQPDSFVGIKVQLVVCVANKRYTAIIVRGRSH